MCFLLSSISFLLLLNSLYATLAVIGKELMFTEPCPHSTKSLSWVTRAQSEHAAVYAYTYRCCFLNVCYFTTVRIKFTLPCYFPVTQYHEVFLNSLQTNCIFAALNNLASSSYFFIYAVFHLLLRIQSQYTSLCDSTRHPSIVKIICIFLCFLCLTNLPLHAIILYFVIRLHEKCFRYVTKLY